MTLHLKKKNYGGENIDRYMHACMHEEKNGKIC
jgi:hypothetical protein